MAFLKARHWDLLTNVEVGVGLGELSVGLGELSLGVAGVVVGLLGLHRPDMSMTLPDAVRIKQVESVSWAIVMLEAAPNRVMATVTAAVRRGSIGIGF